MDNKILKTLGYWATGLILLIATIIVIRWATDFLDWARFGGGDLATWVGAVGAVGAFIGTIRLATNETRRRNTEALTLARLHGAGMTLQVEDAYQRVLQAVAMLDVAGREGRRKEFLTSCCIVLRGADLWKIADVVPLAPSLIRPQLSSPRQLNRSSWLATNWSATGVSTMRESAEPLLNLFSPFSKGRLASSKPLYVSFALAP